MERRAFLGAAAALSGLPAVNNESEIDAEALVENYREKDDGLYQDADCGEVPGSLSHVEIAADMVDAPVSVSAWRDEEIAGVSLNWGSPSISVGTTLDPDDARELSARLRVAAAVADGEIDAETLGGGAGGPE